MRASLAQFHVAMDRDHLHMLVENLLTNAVNYSFNGGTVDVRTERAETGAVGLIVQDEGIGIEADKLPFIFDDYYRTSEASVYNKSSTGLGLAIVRDVARLWELSVEVRTAPSQGTQFIVTFPAPRSATQLAGGSSTETSHGIHSDYR